MMLIFSNYPVYSISLFSPKAPTSFGLSGGTFSFTGGFGADGFGACGSG
ncbi:MAG: hypothetical protein LN566_01590 [Rickettsia endosymbiont of Stiretrus anchorago]|nr:hypothetical protein [Rickettsia endosymbiont of Stiretrus anchorago]